MTLPGGGKGASALTVQAAMVTATTTSARITLAKIQSKIPCFKHAIVELTRKSGLAAVGHGLELLALFP
jgi:hypothetical protein